MRYEPAATVAHDHRVQPGEWLRRRAFYGSGAALLAQRHGAAVAPVVVSPWSAGAWLLALTGRPLGLLAAGGVLADAAVRLARRLAPPGARPPLPLAAALVLRGSAASGRTLARAVTRHHWPLALAAALVSRRARRLVAAVAVADAVGGLVAAPPRDRPARVRGRPAAGGPRLRRRALARRAAGPRRAGAAAGGAAAGQRPTR